MTDLNKAQAVVVDENFDVKERLVQLRAWQSSWQQDDDLLLQRVRQRHDLADVTGNRSGGHDSLRRAFQTHHRSAEPEDPVARTSKSDRRIAVSRARLR